VASFPTGGEFSGSCQSLNPDDSLGRLPEIKGHELGEKGGVSSGRAERFLFVPCRETRLRIFFSKRHAVIFRFLACPACT